MTRTQPTMPRTRRFSKAHLLFAVAAGSIALASTANAQEPATDRPATDRTAKLANKERDELAGTLKARIESLDTARARITGILAKLEAGENVSGLFDPTNDRWFMGRGPRGDGQGRRPGSSDRPRFGGPDRPDQPGRFRGRDQLDETELAEIRALINEYIPQMAARLRVAEETDPVAAKQFLSRIAPRFRDVLVLKKEAPELVEIRLNEMHTGMEIVGATRELRRLRESQPDGEAFTTKRSEIRDLLTKQLGYRQTLERHRLARMAEDLRSATAKLDEQETDREKIIDEHLQRVLSRAFEGPRGNRPPSSDRRKAPGKGRQGHPKPIDD